MIVTQPQKTSRKLATNDNIIYTLLLFKDSGLSFGVVI